MEATKLTATSKAWLAGLCDGEGYFSISVVSQRWTRPIIEVAMTHRRTIHHIRHLLGFGSVAMLPPRNGKHRKIWRYTAASQQAKTLCRTLLPYLITKQKAAELILAWEPRNFAGQRELLRKARRLTARRPTRKPFRRTRYYD